MIERVRNPCPSGLPLSLALDEELPNNQLLKIYATKFAAAFQKREELNREMCKTGTKNHIGIKFGGSS